MRRVTLRSLWEHKRRLISTILSIVLGVSFMSGTLIFADTIDSVFDDLFQQGNENVDALVQGSDLFEPVFGPAPKNVLAAEILSEVRGLEGVRAAEPYVVAFNDGSVNRVLGRDGEAIGPFTGPPTMLESWVPGEMTPYRLTDGSRAPEEAGEVVLNVAAAREGELEIGDDVDVVTQFGTETFELVGTFTFGEADSAAGAIMANFNLAEAQRIAGRENQYDTLFLQADDGVSPEQIVGRLETILPDTARALTATEAAAEQASDVQEGFSFFRRILLIFGGIALVVGSFIIANTFSILIAQRTRELALLRAIGASRRQVLGSVISEASIIGIVASVVGLGGGVLLATAVTSAMSAAGSDLPSNDLVISQSTTVTAFVIGLGVTMLAAVFPAVQATRVPPLAAMRDVAIDRTGMSRTRPVAGALITAFGLFQLTAGWRSDGGTDTVAAVGLGAILVIFGAIVLGPVLAQPTVRLLGRPLPRLRGIAGRLAMENAARSPKRTAATASALLIAVTLVAFLTIFGASARVSVTAEIERGFGGDLVVQSERGFSPAGGSGGFPLSVADVVLESDVVARSARVSQTQLQARFTNQNEEPVFVTGMDLPAGVTLLKARMTEGTLADIGDGEAAINQELAEDQGVVIGDEVTVISLDGREFPLTITAISDDFQIAGMLTVRLDAYLDMADQPTVSQVAVLLEDGVDKDDGKAELRELLEEESGMVVLDEDDFADTVVDQINGFLTLINALLFLSVLIAMIGIANTLSLSIHERTRELGLLRAVGMTKRQLRTSVRWEAVIISMLGTTVGLGLGVLIGAALVGSLKPLGLSQFVVPVAQLAFVVAVAGGLGILASIRPASRAARLDILAAISRE